MIKLKISDTSSYFQKFIAGMKNECRHAVGQDARAYNVGCMTSAINYTPRTLEEIIDRNEEILPE